MDFPTIITVAVVCLAATGMWYFRRGPAKYTECGIGEMSNAGDLPRPGEDPAEVARRYEAAFTHNQLHGHAFGCARNGGESDDAYIRRFIHWRARQVYAESLESLLDLNLPRQEAINKSLEMEKRYRDQAIAAGWYE